MDLIWGIAIQIINLMASRLRFLKYEVKDPIEVVHAFCVGILLKVVITEENKNV
ncbi:hypothetical protein [Acinetobacter sp. ANC 4178]|uniref:hypothetical protein n=1 Tax=Acinetobacter sp. ANC 4178 TaxID=2529839 RepID=UPI0013F1722D|nr:hypothetical protein [Acinetobacter sp. ANC 4178]